MVLLCRSKEIRSNGAYKRGGPHGEVSLSLFIVELERWALILHLLISFDPTNGFMSRNLQVKAFTEPLHFDSLFVEFGHLEAPHEHFGVSWGPSHTFHGIRCTLGTPFSQTGAP